MRRPLRVSRTSAAFFADGKMVPMALRPVMMASTVPRMLCHVLHTLIFAGSPVATVPPLDFTAFSKSSKAFSIVTVHEVGRSEGACRPDALAAKTCVR